MCMRCVAVPTAVESAATEGDSPVRTAGNASTPGQESGCLGLQSKAGGKLHLRLNTDKRPIANKYREGKLKRTLKKELKGREIANREAIGMAKPDVLPGLWSVTLVRSTICPGLYIWTVWLLWCAATCGLHAFRVADCASPTDPS
jgi:hypothetical protein